MLAILGNAACQNDGDDGGSVGRVFGTTGRETDAVLQESGFGKVNVQISANSQVSLER